MGMVVNPYAHGAPPVSDPNFASVSLLLHMDGSNGSTSFTDSSSTAKTVTPQGNAQISTAQSKFGGASGYFDGSGDWLSVPHSSDFDFGSGDFTIEGWIYLNSVAANTHLIGKYNSNPTSPFAIYQSGSGVAFYASSNGTAWDIMSALSCGLFSTGAWHHIAVTRSGNTFSAFKDGVLANFAYSSATLHANTGAVTIGSNNSGSEGYNGYLDDWRITKGVARYVANFTPPTAAFPNS